MSLQLVPPEQDSGQWLENLDELFGRFVSIHAELMEVSRQILEEIPKGSVYGFDEERVTQRYAGRLARLTKEERMTIGPIFRERLSQRQVGIICGVGRSAIRNDELRSRQRSSLADSASEDQLLECGCPEASAADCGHQEGCAVTETAEMIDGAGMTTVDQTLARINEFLDDTGSAETRVRPLRPDAPIRQCPDAAPHSMHVDGGTRCPGVMRLEGRDDDWVPSPGDRSPKAARRRRQVIRAMNEAGSDSRQISQHLGISQEGVRNIARKIHLVIRADDLVGKSRAARGPDFMVEAMINDLSALVPSFDMIDVAELDHDKLTAWARIFRSAARDINEFALRIERRLKTPEEKQA